MPSVLAFVLMSVPSAPTRPSQEARATVELELDAARREEARVLAERKGRSSGAGTPR